MVVCAQWSFSCFFSVYTNNAQNGEFLERFRLGGTETRSFSQEILAACRKTTFELYEEMAAEDETFNTVYRQWQDFRDRLYKWNRVSSLSYGQFAFKNV